MEGKEKKRTAIGVFLNRNWQQDVFRFNKVTFKLAAYHLIMSPCSLNTAFNSNEGNRKLYGKGCLGDLHGKEERGGEQNIGSGNPPQREHLSSVR